MNKEVATDKTYIPYLERLTFMDDALTNSATESYGYSEQIYSHSATFPQQGCKNKML